MPNQRQPAAQNSLMNMASLFKLSFFFTILAGILLARTPFINLKHPLKAAYIKLPKLPEAVGNLTPNDKLVKASYIGHKKLHGPETIVFSANGSMYTGLMNGQIVRIDDQGIVHKVAQIGTENNQTLCDLTVGIEPTCGRPLGLRIKPNTNILYVADAYFGLFKVDLDNGNKELVLGANDARFGLQPMKLTNDFDFGGKDNEILYIIDSSFQRGVHEAIEELLDGDAKGRLIMYNEKTNRLDFLLDNLYFPNGIQLMPDKQALLINECSMSRIIKYYLNGPKKGVKEVWAELPGYGDTLRLTKHHTIMAPIAGSRYSKIPSFLDLLGEYPTIRSIIGFIFDMRALFMILPKYGLLIEYDLNGQVLKSWHDPAGATIECTTQAELHNNKLYIGSFYNDFIGVVDY